MTNITTLDCQIYLSSYYADKRIDTKSEDWELIDKYKNYTGETCRDFFNTNLNIKAIVILNKKSNEMSIIENANYKYFLDMLKDKAILYYVPIITEYGISYYFNKVTKEDDLDINKIEYISKKFDKIFKEYINTHPNTKIFNKDYEKIVKSLEENNIRYNEDLYEKINFKHIRYNKNIHQIKNIYNVKNLSEKELMNNILNLIISKKIDDVTIGNIQSILKRLNNQQIESLENIIENFTVHENILTTIKYYKEKNKIYKDLAYLVINK